MMDSDYILKWALTLIGGLILATLVGLARFTANRLKSVTESINSKADQSTVLTLIATIKESDTTKGSEADKDAAAAKVEEEAHRKRMYDRFDQLGTKLDLLATKAEVVERVALSTTRSDDQSIEHSKVSVKQETKLDVLTEKTQQLYILMDGMPKQLEQLQKQLEQLQQRERERDAKDKL